ncbi:hypothetical protein [Caldifermentibacillus hisashii]|jgi:hypothetical protein
MVKTRKQEISLLVGLIVVMTIIALKFLVGDVIFSLVKEWVLSFVNEWIF